MPDVGILEVRDSCENVVSSRGNKLGHKVCVIYVGKEPIDSNSEPKKVTSYRKLIDLAAGLKYSFKTTENTTKRGLECMAVELTELVKAMHDKCLITIKADRRSRQSILVSRLDGFKKDVVSKASAAKVFYEFGSAVKSGFKFQDDASGEAPPLNELGDTLINKLKDLYQADLSTTSRLLDTIYGVNFDNRGKWTSDDKEFTRILLSTSDSGARDYLNISLKITKAILRNNEAIRHHFYNICEGCVRIGFFPAVWCKDQISFLWKNKGEKSDPSMYRPITIAPSLGKHLEKVISNYLDSMDDRNYHNHAYIKDRSCLSAVIDVQIKMMEAAILAEGQLAEGEKIITIISADDIAEAFESIEHAVICDAVRRSFTGDSGFNVADAIDYYLKQRESFAFDRATDEKYKIHKTYMDKTSPQGSILSPRFWRIFDAVFTELYLEKLRDLAVAHPFIRKISHVSYADDHLTIISLVVHVEEPEYYVAAKIKTCFEATRRLLFEATTAVGCSIQPLKSESIVRAADSRGLAEFYPSFEVKESFKWLGFRLKIEDAQLSFCKKGVSESIRKALNLCWHIFQVSSGVHIRWKTYKTYVVPFIELFLPFQIQEGLDKATDVTRAQHSCLSNIVGLTTRNNSKRLREVLAELSVKSKAIRLSKRFQKFGNWTQNENETSRRQKQQCRRENENKKWKHSWKPVMD